MIFYYRETGDFGYTAHLNSFSPAHEMAAHCRPGRARVSEVAGERWVVVRREDTPLCEVTISPRYDVSVLRLSDLIMQAALSCRNVALSMCLDLITFAYDGFPPMTEYTCEAHDAWTWRVGFAVGPA